MVILNELIDLVFQALAILTTSIRQIIINFSKIDHYHFQYWCPA